MGVRTMAEVALVAIVIVLLAVLWMTGKADKFAAVSNFSQAFFHLLAGVGILLTGFWFIAQKDWAPKTAVDVQTDVALLEIGKDRTALLHVAVAITNASRVPHKFGDIRIAARAYDANTTKVGRFGDLAQRDVDRFKSSVPIRINPGETDFTYAELRVPCAQNIVQLLVKVTEPRHPTQDTKHLLVYERKMIVPISGVCSGGPPTRIAHPRSGISS